VLVRPGVDAVRRPGLRRDARAQALIEFALVLPVLLLLVLGIIEFGRAWNLTQVVTDVAREGARRAVVFDPTVTLQQVHDAMMARLYESRIDTTVVTITFSGTPANGGWHQSGQPQTVTVGFPYSWLFFGRVLGRIRIESHFTMRNE